jgi:transcriptional regulator with XRE-family HTH domain
MGDELVKTLTVFGVEWSEEARNVRENTGSLPEINWARSLRDMEVFGRMMQDILKVDLSPVGKPGPRASVSERDGAQRLQELWYGSYSLLPFPDALEELTGGHSYRRVAEKAGVNRNVVDRMRRGVLRPDAYTLAAIARAYGKAPNYFAEYRHMVVVALMLERMLRVPETSVTAYRRLVNAGFSDV